MRTTAKDFARFKDEFRRWQKLLGLTDWRMRFHHEPLDNNAAACVTPDCQARVSGVYLGFTIDHDVAEAARHEALELLLADLGWLPSQRYVREEEVNVARHMVIRRLEHLFDERGEK